MRLDLHKDARRIVTPVVGQTDLFDCGPSGSGAVQGLVLRVFSTDRRSFYVQYRSKQTGERRRFKLGDADVMTVTQARAEARKLLAQNQLGNDPVVVNEQAKQARVAADEAATFGDLVEQYKVHAKANSRPTTVYSNSRIIESKLTGWMDRKATEIKRSDVAALYDGIYAAGHGVMANRTLALVSTIFNLAIGRGVVEVNPTLKFPRTSREVRRERVLTDAELRRLWGVLSALVAAKKMPTKIAVFFRIAILTGQRAREVLGMTRAELDFDRAIWTLPAGRTKNCREHVVPLTRQVMDLIDSIKSDSLFIFPNTSGAKAIFDYEFYLPAIRDAAELDDFRFHDLRRTATTGMAGLGVDDRTLDRVTNHTVRGVSQVAAIYNRHGYEDEKRAALTLWANHVDTIIAPEPAALRLVPKRANQAGQS
jgi:integrase